MRQAWRLVLFLTVFIDLVGFGMVIPFLSFYAREYGASGATVGGVVGIYSIMQFFFAPVWGRLSDRIGRRPVMLISLTASCIGYFTFGFARNLTVLYASRVIAGIGGANIGTAQAYIADMTTEEERAKGMGLIGAAFGMGFMIGPALSGLLTPIGVHLGWHANILPGLVASAFSLTAFTIALFALPESKKPGTSVRTGLPPQFDPQTWRSILRSAIVFAIMAALFLTLLAVSGMETGVTLHARDRFHFTQVNLSVFFFAMAVIVVVIQGLLIGVFAKRVGERVLIAIGTAAFTAGLAIVPSIFDARGLYGITFLFGIGQGLTYPSLTSLLTKVTPSAEHGSILGLSSGIGSLARFFGPILSGFLYDLSGARGAFYGGALLTLGAFALAVWMLRLPAGLEA